MEINSAGFGSEAVLKMFKQEENVTWCNRWGRGSPPSEVLEVSGLDRLGAVVVYASVC